MKAGRGRGAAAREWSTCDGGQHEDLPGVQPPAQHECEQSGEQAQQGQAHARVEVVPLAGRRVTLALVSRRGRTVAVIAVSVYVGRGDDRQGGRRARPVRPLVAGEPVHREDGEEHGEEGPRGPETQPMRVLPAGGHAVGL